MNCYKTVLRGCWIFKHKYYIFDGATDYCVKCGKKLSLQQYNNIAVPQYIRYKEGKK